MSEKSISKMLFSNQEKVELGNMSALKGALLILKNIEKKATSVVDDLIEKVDRSIRSWREMNKYRNEIYNFTEREVEGILKTFEANAKELGIKANDIQEYKEVKKLQDTAKQVIKLLDRIEVPKEPLA